jgi:hypothetical protein
VTDDGFAVTLNFGDRPEPLYIPYDAIRTFVDPSVEFGLRFETQEETSDEIDAPTPVETTESDKPAKPAKGGDAEVVSLDKFRK